MGGFIPGSRGSFMLDLVATAMFAILPALAFAVDLVKRKHSYAAHKKMMMIISAVLGTAVILFEIEMRLVGWRDLAKPSPYYLTTLPTLLAIHLFFAISTTLALTATVTLALRRFQNPPRPGAHSNLHTKLGKVSATGLFMTSITGWIFYYMAFLAG